MPRGTVVKTRRCARSLVKMGVVRFNLLGTKVQIQPGFWLLILFLALATQRSLASQLTLGVTLLLTIVVHELGHALMARRLGLNPVIVIHTFGGITTYAPPVVLTRSIAIRVTLAGPALGLLSAVLGLMVLKLGPMVMGHPWSSMVSTALLEFTQINAFWSIVNLLPVMPFDGGQVLVLLLGPTKRLLAARISLVFGCLAALALYQVGLSVAAVVFAVASAIQYVASRRLQEVTSAAVGPREVETLLTQARRALEEGDHAGAMRLSRSIVDVAPATPIRRKAAEIYAWSALGKEEFVEARRALEWMSDGAIDPLLQAALLEAEGDCDRAIHCLRQARVAGDERAQLAASLIRLLLGVDRYGEAALTTIQILEHVSVEEARQVIAACREGGRPVPAAELAEALFSVTGEATDLVSAVDSYLAAGDREAACSAFARSLHTRLTPSQIEACLEWPKLAEDADLMAIFEDSKAAT